jgi:hypothetical protein
VAIFVTGTKSFSVVVEVWYSAGDREPGGGGHDRSPSGASTRCEHCADVATRPGRFLDHHRHAQFGAHLGGDHAGDDVAAAGVSGRTRPRLYARDAPILAYAERALYDASLTSEVETIRTGGSGRAGGIMLVALPLTLAHDTGDVGLVARALTQPTLQIALDAFVQAKEVHGEGSVDRAIPYA